MIAKDPMDIWEARLGFVRGYERAHIGEGVVLSFARGPGCYAIGKSHDICTTSFTVQWDDSCEQLLR